MRTVLAAGVSPARKQQSAMPPAPQPDHQPGHPREVPASADPLAQTLHLLKLTGALYCRAELNAPWGIDLPPIPETMMFHIVMAGTCSLETDGAEPVTLTRGGLALIPHGTGHKLRSRKGAKLKPLFDIPVDTISDRYEIMRHGGDGEETQTICVVVKVDNAVAEHVIAQLPPVLIVDAHEDDDWLHSTIRFISREAKEPRPGSETVITRLADILVIQSIRAWIDSQDSRGSAWFNAMRDPQLGNALSAIYREPERDWSVESLASEASLSRSAFSARFTTVMGQSVMQYLAKWRMRLARSHLCETAEPLASLASRLGYKSEAAFCRAYKREFNETPGQTRKQAPATDALLTGSV